MNFKDAIVEVKEAYDIDEFIESSGVSLKPSGVDKLKGLCPFHSEKTPSFTVDTQFQNYRCFGCGASGDIFSYVCETENLSFKEALRLLADSKGIALEESSDEDSVDYAGLRAVTKETALYFYRSFKKLPEDHEAKTQISERGLDISDSVFGYAPGARNSLYSYLKKKNFSDELILQTGVCKRNSKTDEIFDFWSNRLMFIVTDIQGRPIAFSGRRLRESDKMGKYVNSSESPIFSKGKSLYNLKDAKNSAKSQGLYICEGQFDVASFVHAGLTNTVASLGTAFTERQADLCIRIAGNSRLTFCFDGDSAGLEATRKIFRLTPRLHSVSDVVVFPKDQDPCDYRLENGNSALKSYVEENRTSLVEFVLDLLKSSSDLSTMAGRSSYLARACEDLALVTDRAIRESAAGIVSLNAVVTLESVLEGIEEASKELKKKEKNKSSRRAKNSEDDEVTESDQGSSETPSEESDPEEELIELIESDKRYFICSKLLAISARNPSVKSKVIKIRKDFPLEMVPLLEELKAMRQKIIIENLSMPTVARKIYLEIPTYTDLMTEEDLQSHVKTLVEILRSLNRKEREETEERTVMEILSRKGASVKDLKTVSDNLPKIKA